MSELLQSRFDQSPVHLHLQTATDELERLNSEPWDSPEAQALEYIDSVRCLLDYARIRLGLQDPRTVTAARLDHLSSTAGNLAGALQAFNAERSIDTAQAAHSAAETLVDGTCMLPLAPSPDEVRLAEATLDAVRSERERASASLSLQVETSASSLERAQAAINESMQELKETAETANAGLADATAEVKAEVEGVATSLASRHADFEAATAQLEQQRAAAIRQINEVLTGIESRHGEAETARVSQFTAAESERKAAFGDFSKAAKSEHDALIDAVRRTEEQAETVLQLAGGAALSARWIKQARDQRIERYSLLGALAILSIGSVVFSFFHLDEFTAPADSGFVESLIFYFPRLPLAIITLTVLAFLIQQTSRRSLWEARDRRVANELTALPSFLAGLEGQKLTLAEKVADRYFPGPQVDHDEPKHDERPPSPVAIPSSVHALLASLSGTAALAIALIIALSK
ncbi:MAG: hypothetical protein AB7T37_12730 [Dehalococcoidia bacterium]